MTGQVAEGCQTAPVKGCRMTTAFAFQSKAHWALQVCMSFMSTPKDGDLPVVWHGFHQSTAL